MNAFNSALVPKAAPLVLEPARRPASLTRYFYVLAGVLALFFVLAGFTRTYFIPLSAGAFRGTALVHLHGLIFFLWIALAIVQPLLVQTRLTQIHRKLGVFGFCLALTMVGVGIGVGIASAQAKILRGEDAFAAKAFLVLPLTDMLLFGALIGFALIHLKNQVVHKRLMVLATLSILPAAFGRIFPLIGITDLSPRNILLGLLLQESILFLGMAHDLATRRKIQPVYAWGGAAVILVHLLRIPLGNAPGWQSLATWLIG